jgi:hypothetical protein
MELMCFMELMSRIMKTAVVTGTNTGGVLRGFQRKNSFYGNQTG